MKTKSAGILLGILMTPVVLAGQNTAPAPPPGGRSVAIAGKAGNRIFFRTEMGKWWRDPEIAKKLQLTDNQTSQLDQVFYDHKLKLIDYGAEMEKQDLKLQSLLDADQPDEGQVSSQVDLVLAARGKLEREYTFMNLDLRKVLSLEQWRELKSIRGERGPKEKILFFQKQIGPGAGMMMPPPQFPDLPPPPPDPNF